MIRLRCTPAQLHQMLLSNFLGRVYPPDGSKGESAQVVLDSTTPGLDGKPSTYKAQLLNLSGAINSGIPFDDEDGQQLVNVDPEPIPYGVIRIPLVLTPGYVYCGRSAQDGGYSAGLTSGGMPFIANIAAVRGDLAGGVTYVGGSPRLPVKGGGWCMFTLAPGVVTPQAGYYDIM